MNSKQDVEAEINEQLNQVVTGELSLYDGIICLL
jgi:hypothetical protein